MFDYARHIKVLSRILTLVSGLCFWGCGSSPELEALVPNAFQAQTRQAVEVRGSGFEADTLFIFRSGEVDVSLGNLVVESSTLATGIFPPAAPSGVYDLIVKRGDDETLFEDVLTILAGQARIVFVDIGQGDATLVIAPTGESALIDGGPNDQRAILDALDTYANGRLDAVILSHRDADHLGGLVRVLSGRDAEVATDDDLEIETKWSNSDDGSCDSLTCRRLRALNGAPFSQPEIGRVLTLGEIEIEVVARDGDVGAGPVIGADSPNEKSLVVLIRFADRKVLVLGDLTGGGDGDANVEEPLAERLGRVDVLRTAHHGSRTSTNLNALELFSPRAAVLSVGTDNPFCHPETSVLQRLADNVPLVVGTGEGIVSRESCDETLPYENVSLGLGDIVLDIFRDGSMVLADSPL